MSVRGRRVRDGLARVVAVGAAVFWGFLFFGLVDLMTPFTLGAAWADHYLMETGWGLLYLVLVTVPLVVLVVSPGSPVALLQLVLVAVAVATGAVLARSPEHLLPAVGLLVNAGALAALSPPRGLGPLGPPRFLVALAAVAVLPAAAYAWDMARATENPEETWGLDHYPAQAAFAVAVVLVALLAAYVVRGPGRARWLPALTSGLSAVWMGVLSMVWPQRLGSWGTGWGLAAIAWGVVLVVVAAFPGTRASAG
jgi:hypothetical protein